MKTRCHSSRLLIVFDDDDDEDDGIISQNCKFETAESNVFEKFAQKLLLACNLNQFACDAS